MASGLKLLLAHALSDHSGGLHGSGAQHGELLALGLHYDVLEQRHHALVVRGRTPLGDAVATAPTVCSTCSCTGRTLLQ